jgi:hypothetical protein
MRRTVPQIVMLNHAAWKENEDSELRAQARRAAEDRKRNEDEVDPIIPEMGGKRMSEIQNNGQLLNAYLGDWSGFG